MSELFEWIQSMQDANPDVWGKVLSLLAAVAGLWLLRMLVLVLIRQQRDDVRSRYWWRKNSAYAFVAVTVVTVLWIWFDQLRSMGTFLGLLSAGLTVALREPLINLVGWIFILWRRPLSVGDRIQIGDHAGDVVDLRIFEFTLLEIGNWVAADQSTGRIVHIPNGHVFSQALINYSKGLGYIWNEIPVRVTFESDWRVSKSILQQIIDRHVAQQDDDVEQHVQQAGHRFLILYNTLTPMVYTRGDRYGVLLTVRYLCKPRERRASETAIWEAILEAFASHPEIEFAYPTQRFYDRRLESVQQDHGIAKERGTRSDAALADL